ncbi:hypothetical protein THRCLA_07222 [Thraustotheca clavata]|uniref:Methyltransferase type 11 domain-containing protein n=1 Tax=Thraustotheca clavata TaxID=74557 RepID=A0A1V9ZFL6_9STRA|nr:hypothetical protein THRCLA_07222 [Thraustotheca clavata]
MPYNRPPPEERSRRPDRFYSVSQASVYHSQANASIQQEITSLALSLLPSQEDLSEAIILDIGCGSGLSTEHVPCHSIGVDISLPMLQLATSTTSTGFVCAAAFALPFRNELFDHAISISMLQWLSSDQLVSFFNQLKRVLLPSATAIFQVYPLDIDHANEMIQTAINCTGKHATFIADFPHKNSALKWFLCIEPRSTIIQEEDEKCPLARRMHGSCAYNYRQKRGLTNERLVYEHIQYAWHAYRKVLREQYLRENEPAKKKHRKERSIFPNEQQLVKQLLSTFCTKLTLDILKKEADRVIHLMHATYKF